MEVSKKLCHPAKDNRRAGAQEGDKGEVNPLGGPGPEVPKSEGSEGQNRRRDLHATTGGSADYMTARRW